MAEATSLALPAKTDAAPPGGPLATVAPPALPQKPDDKPVPFGWPAQRWATVEALLKIVALAPLAVGAVIYGCEAPDREANVVREAWRGLLQRPQFEEIDDKSIKRTIRVANWGGKSALETLVSKKQKLNSIDLSGADLSEAKLAGGQFGWTGLQGTSFWEADVSHATFQCADLRGATFGRADIRGANFSGANVTGAFFGGGNMDVATVADRLKTACIDPNEPGVGISTPYDAEETKKIGAAIPRCEIVNPGKPAGKGC